MKILITGGAGFIGSAVARLAIKQGHQVINIDSLTYAASLENVASISNHVNYEFEKVDIRNNDALANVFNKYKPHAVMHLAAESHVDRSITNPANFIETNIIGTYNLLECSRHYWDSQGRPSTFKFHHISTDEVFGSLGPQGLFTEQTRYDPRSPYSASKASSDHLARAWHETYDLPVVISNCSNNYGPYHFPEKLIPLTILNALMGKSLPVYGNGSNIRDWLFVEDHASALMLILQKGSPGRSYNVGGGNERSNLEVVRTICSILDNVRPLNNGQYRELIEFVPDRPGHDARYAIDYSRIKRELNWEPSVTFEEGLEKTIDWYLNNKNWWYPLLERDGVGKRLGTLN